MTLSIAGVPIGGEHPCRFVAEMSNSFNGDANTLKRMIVAAKESGADFAKFQAYLPAELIALRGDGRPPEPWASQGFTMFALYDRARTPLDWFDWIPDYCEAVGIPWFASVFGEQSLEVLEDAKCPAYKLAALDRSQQALVRKVRGTGKPTIRSARMTEYGYPDIEAYTKKDLILLCPEGYPQRETALSRFRFLVESASGYDDRAPFDGYSYHGIDERVPALAGILGASLVECHFHLSDEPSELEADVSLTEKQFAEMVGVVRDVEAMLA